MTGAGKQAWVCLVCEVSTVQSAKFPKCPKCGVRMVAAAPTPAPPDLDGEPCACLCHLAAIQTACPHEGCEPWVDREVRERLDAMLAGFARIKALTKEHPATLWDDAYRRLANEIHTVGRECFWV